jgi:twitching motility protein PilT
VSAQLEQIVGYLDREGVSEVVISVGRPIAMKQRDTFVNLTARPLTPDQLHSILRGSPVAAMVPDTDGMAEPAEVQIGRRRARVQVGRRGDEIVVRFEKPRGAPRTGDGAPRAKTATGPGRVVETTRSKSPTGQGAHFIRTPRAVSPTSLMPPEPAEPPRRNRPPTNAPHAKAPAGRSKGNTHPPRTKTPTSSGRSESTTNAPRTKAPTNAPREKESAPLLPSIGKRAPWPPAEAMSLDIDVGTLQGANATMARPPAPAAYDVELGSLPGARGEPVLPGVMPVSLDQLDLDPATPALELDPADARAAIAAADAAADARPTWDAGSLFPPGRATPVPLAARRAVAAATPGTGAAASARLRAPGAALPAGADMPAVGAALPRVGAALPAAAGGPAATSAALPASAAPVLGDGPLAQLVKRARDRGASDLHVASGRPVSIRTGGELVALDAQPLTLAMAEQMLLPLLDGVQREQLERLGYADLAVPLASGGRLRANITRHQAGLKGTFRIAMPHPPTLDELGLPKDLAKVVAHHQGLVVIAGPSGHGKTTTLAALVDIVNASKPHHILTVEDPIEIVYPRKAAVVSQREAGRHTKSFAAALKASLREDPDVIVIGELRDRETVEIALTASETGHLVLATMSTPSAAKTIERLIDMFPPDEHTQVRASIAGALRAIVAQRLLPARDGKIAAAVELVTGVLPLAVLIRDDKLYQLPNLMQRGKAFGMIRFDDSLAELVRAGKISEDTALAYASNRTELAAALRRPS